MNHDKKIYLSLLYDFYGGFLTQKQQKIIELYVNEDLTLTEISEQVGISRQGVYDTFKKAEQLLNMFELKLNLAQKYYKTMNVTRNIIERLENIYNRYHDKEILNIINSIQEWLKNDI